MPCLLFDNKKGEFTWECSLDIEPWGRSLVWTDCRLLDTCRYMEKLSGLEIMPQLTFRRLGEGMTQSQSLKLCGFAVDIGKGLADAELDRLRKLCTQSGLFSFVALKSIAPKWVACELRGETWGHNKLQSVFPGDRGCHVLALQDALLLLGRCELALTGVCDKKTVESVRILRREAGLPDARHVDSMLWNYIITEGHKRAEASDRMLYR